MVLFSTPTSTTSEVFATVSENIASPGLGTFAIVVVALVATFWTIEMLIRGFSDRPLMYDNEPQEPPFDNHDE